MNHLQYLISQTVASQLIGSCIVVVVFTNRYHLHVAAFELSRKTTGRRRSTVEFGISTAIAIVSDVVDGLFLLVMMKGVHL